jgi:D-glycero-alpha-D-manno-heptose-7-phosphate kinase
MLKKQLEKSVSNPQIEHMYDTALRAGALGGKLLGAGGGGFLILYVPQERQHNVRKELHGYHEIKIKINEPGSSIIYS